MVAFGLCDATEPDTRVVGILSMAGHLQVSDACDRPVLLSEREEGLMAWVYWDVVSNSQYSFNTLPHRGPLHTRAKSRDHDIVRAQKKVSKGRPNTPPTSCSVVTDPRV